MKKKLNKEENDLCRKEIMDYLKKESNIDDVEKELKDKYKDFIVYDLDCFEIANEFYIDEDKYDDFKSDFDKYVIENIKDLCVINLNVGNRYIPEINSDDPDIDNSVENGTLIIKMNRLINYAADPVYRIDRTREIEDYIKKFENNLSNKLEMKVRVLFNDVITFDENSI